MKAALADQLARVNQAHLLRFWDELTEDQRRQLADDINAVPLDRLPHLTTVVRGEGAAETDLSNIQPPLVVSKSSVGRAEIEHGQSLIAAGKVAPFTVAGGQGTRLGFDGPKGAFEISPVKNKSLFRLFAEHIRATERRYDVELTWYIMTSPINHVDTVAYFETNRYFELTVERVKFFQQGVMPSFSTDGQILLADKHRLALSPDGHGGSLLALAQSGMLKDMAAKGIEHISYFQVDNPLVHCIDPAFIGLHDRSGSEMSSKSLAKADDFEKVGNFVMVGDQLRVIEYSNMPDKIATARNDDGSRKYDAGSIAIHLIRRAFVERLTADPAAFGLPWHRAVKKVPHVDLKSGTLVEPDEPNAVKLESFIFDALPLAQKPLVMEVERADEFSPVKNAEGVDSVATAKRDMSRRAAQWLQHAGVSVSRDADGYPPVACEISPMVALDADELKHKRLPKVVSNEPVYLGE